MGAGARRTCPLSHSASHQNSSGSSSKCVNSAMPGGFARPRSAYSATMRSFSLHALTAAVVPHSNGIPSMRHRLVPSHACPAYPWLNPPEATLGLSSMVTHHTVEFWQQQRLEGAHHIRVLDQHDAYRRRAFATPEPPRVPRATPRDRMLGVPATSNKGTRRRNPCPFHLPRPENEPLLDCCMTLRSESMPLSHLHLNRRDWSATKHEALFWKFANSLHRPSPCRASLRAGFRR